MSLPEIAYHSYLIPWAIERSRAIVIDQGGDVALAARDMSNDKIIEAAKSLGQVIVDALIEVFDGVMQDS
ncbi:MAG: hypothetical protein EOP21_01095 [Hyphomicrobiales bacterium]|nr:MAG: hypothetical protein EOP21_01095 [Hyphomicrobiales bacterium]